MKFIKPLVLLLTFVFMVVGCSSEDASNSEQSTSDLDIYTTVYPLQYIVEEIGGDTVNTHSVYPPGADGHTYEPTSKEMTDFAKSDAFIYIGEGMEGFAESVSGALESQDVRLIEIGKHEELFQHEHAGHEGDNHDHDDHDHDSHDHEGEEEQAVSVNGLADHYHTGDTIELTAEHDEDADYDHWHWFTRDSDSEEWEIAEGQNGDTYEGEATVSEQQIKAELYDDDHEVVAESDPVTITIDDHEHDEGDHDHDGHDHDGEEEQAISVDGLAGHYHTGDTIELTAEYNEEADHDHWHWFTRDSDSEEWEIAEGQNGDTYEGEATVSEQQIKAELYDDDHEVVAESDPVTITIDDHEDHDPHIWTDPLRVIKVAEILKEELIELNPNEEERYNENFDALKSELTDLDERYKDVLDTKENKHIIVPHAAFGYWEERYGVEQIPISGLSSSEEPSQKALTEVIDAAEEYDLDYILYEQNSKNRLSEVIQDQIGAEAVMIHNLEVRTEEDIENGKDYIELMDDNLQALDKITK
ncbi:zinc ABC transporter substrate-binding protein [Virgibacillus sp. NKC19-3]|uniref:metal ABC transporter solute-binding protein, Zn/Mn family n=1 Tax=Virgibacillus saliphilus TaxID=2831674 RepID=UPI001C9B0EB3|nr:zinc ABC transporter substrate-binding protein [Virgibacillus sp. NKC19-3]MBY7142631.1 zinc ABC transporter substrate-binding protein [Virgibacillus sp. NKC19-3]